ncbi:hypothetical protein XFUD_02910 [Xylella fastidiosa]|uniref:Uncharacterized protein n=1 Tax=Xylella fastidiosa (strain 9a5c) TaxID=160492 RepID=Q9PFG6_XYLFA|nr:hypothetical protein [Xylella fastidiosa]AAF83503.1 hypothetical protein XF_0693 [Xylella fastidiosa 9a5c]ALQ94275.1 hypothetical protein XFUD_02910 [Xylella fastidiosa]
MASIISEQAQPQANQALSGTQKAPLFYFNGIRDAKGGELQRANYSYEKPHDRDNSAIRVIATHYTRFSPLVHTCFEVYNSTDVMTDYFDNDKFTVATTHPLYPHVKAALEAVRNRSAAQLAASEKKRQEKRNAARAALEAAKKEACAAYDAAKDEEARDAAFAAARAALATYEAAEAAVSKEVAA